MTAPRVNQQSADHHSVQVTLPSDRDILIVRDFAAPRDLVFEAWTEAEHLAQWWDPTGARLASCDVDLRPNGTFRFISSGGHPPFVGTYREIVRPERLVFSTVVSPSGAESLGTVLFEEREGGTTLRLTIACASKADRDALLQMRVDVGTLQTLENLSEYVVRMSAGAR